MTVALAIPPLSVKNRNVRLIGHVRLIGGIQYLQEFNLMLDNQSGDL